MWLEVNPRSVVPMYQQLVEGVKAAIAKGVLQPGSKLPSVRELSVDLMINHNTVQKAYQELERECVIEVIRGRGTFVTAEPMVVNEAVRKADLRETLRKVLVEAHHLKMTEEDVLKMVREVIHEWQAERRQL